MLFNAVIQSKGDPGKRPKYNEDYQWDALSIVLAKSRGKLYSAAQFHELQSLVLDWDNVLGAQE